MNDPGRLALASTLTRLRLQARAVLVSIEADVSDKTLDAGLTRLQRCMRDVGDAHLARDVLRANKPIPGQLTIE